MALDQLKLSPEEAIAFHANNLLSVEHAIALAERWLEVGISSLALACLLGETPSTWGELEPDFERAMTELGVQTPAHPESDKLCLVILLRAFLADTQPTSLTLEMLRRLVSQSRNSGWVQQAPKFSAFDVLLFEIDEWPYIHPELYAPTMTYEASLAQLMEELRAASRELLQHLALSTDMPNSAQPA
jgi:hypothetical protein